MNKATYWQAGETLDYKNVTDTFIEAGEIVSFGGRIGVAGTPIPVGVVGTIHVGGIFKMPKKDGEEITMGADVYYTADGITAVGSEANGALVGNSDVGEGKTADGGKAIGYAAEAASAAQGTVLVKILG